MLTVTALHRRRIPVSAPADKADPTAPAKTGAPPRERKTEEASAPTRARAAQSHAARAQHVATEAQRREAVTASGPAASPAGTLRGGLDNNNVTAHVPAPAPRSGAAESERPPDAYPGDEDRAPSREEAVQAKLEAYRGQSVPDAQTLEKSLAQTKAWGALTNEEQQATRKQLNTPGDEGRLVRAQTDAVLKAPGFAEKEGLDQLDALDPAVFPRLPLSPKHALDALRENAAFKNLDEKTRGAIAGALAPKSPMAGPLTEMTEDFLRTRPDPDVHRQTMEQFGRVAKLAAAATLGGETKARAADMMLNDRPPFAVSQVVESLTTSPAFRASTPAAQHRTLNDAGNALFPDMEGPEGRPPSPSATSSTPNSDISQDPAFGALSAQERSVHTRLTSGTTPIAEQARARRDALRRSDMYKNADRATQATVLRNLQHLGALPEGVNNVTPSDKPQGSAAVTGSRDTRSVFETGEGPVREHDVRITRGDRAFDVKVQIRK